MVPYCLESDDVQDDIVKDFGPFLAIDLRLGLLLMGWLRMTWDWSAVG